MSEPGTRELDRAAEPGTVVPCPLRAHQPIAMGRCVEYQRDNGCHCEHALVALRHTAKFLAGPFSGTESPYAATARQDQLDGVRALMERAEQIEKARPAAAPAMDLVAGLRERRAAQIAAAVEARRKEHQPAPPAKENSMVLVSDLSDDEIRKAYEASGGSISKTMKKLGTTSWASVKKRCDALCLSAKAVPPKAVRDVTAAVNKRLAADPPDSAPPVFDDLPQIDKLPPAYLIACARYLYELRRRIEFALSDEPFRGKA